VVVVVVLPTKTNPGLGPPDDEFSMSIGHQEAQVLYWKKFLTPTQANDMLRQCVKLSKDKKFIAEKYQNRPLRRSSLAVGKVGTKYSCRGASHIALVWPKWLLGALHRL